MTEPWGTEHVEEVLHPHGIEVLRLPEDTSTAALAAQALGTAVATIVKSLVFLAGDDPLLVLVSGDRKLDRKRLARELGVEKVRLAPAPMVIEVAGYAVGGVPPVAHRTPMRTLLDRELLRHDVVYAAAGSSYAVFPIEPARLQAITGAELTDATEA